MILLGVNTIYCLKTLPHDGCALRAPGPVGADQFGRLMACVSKTRDRDQTQLGLNHRLTQMYLTLHSIRHKWLAWCLYNVTDKAVMPGVFGKI